MTVLLTIIIRFKSVESFIVVIVSMYMYVAKQNCENLK